MVVTLDQRCQHALTSCETKREPRSVCHSALAFFLARRIIAAVTAPFDVDRCEALATQAGRGDAAAWKRLLEVLWPLWTEIVRSRRALGPLRASDDHVHNIMLRLMERLGSDEGRGLGLFVLWK